MPGDDLLVVFLDANVLAKPVTRTLVLRCAASGYTAVWSSAAEQEADRHLAGRKLSVAMLRDTVGIVLSPSGQDLERFPSTPVGDRQILADAQQAGATFVVTEDVDDFAAADLRIAAVSAVNPDLFLARLVDQDTYLRALGAMASGMSDPSRTPAQLHSAIARQHPRLYQRFHDLFEVQPEVTGHREAAVLYRGVTCLRCLTKQPAEDDLVEGLCRTCMATV